MYHAYKVARKKRHEREQRRTGLTAETRPSSDSPGLLQLLPLLKMTRSNFRLWQSVPVQYKDCSPSAATGNGTSRNDSEKKRWRRYRLKLIISLLAPFTLQALDTTIIASALPYIAASFELRLELDTICLGLCGELQHRPCYWWIPAGGNLVVVLCD